MKHKYLRAIQGRFMMKDLHKATMERSRLRNKFLSNRTEMSRKEYKKQQNFCVNLMKGAKKEHFANVDVNSVLDNQKFLQIIKILFSNKVKTKTTIKLVRNNEMIDNEIEIAKLIAVSTENTLSEVEIDIAKYRNHPSINAIIEKMEKLGNPTFGFNSTPPGMRCRSDVSFRSPIGWDVADHAETSSRRHNRYVNGTDLFETSLRRLIGT